MRVRPGQHVRPSIPQAPPEKDPSSGALCTRPLRGYRRPPRTQFGSRERRWSPLTVQRIVDAVQWVPPRPMPVAHR